MHPLAALRITVCGILLATDRVKGGVANTSAGPLPVPSLSLRTPINISNIELFSDVALVCTPPKEAPYPIVLILGRDTRPRSEYLSFKLTNADGVRFSFPAESTNEGVFVCWYNVSRTRQISGSSNPLHIAISSLPPPTISIDSTFIPVGKKYIVQCQANPKYSNITLSLYDRKFQSPSPEELQLLGSLTLAGNHKAAAVNITMAAGMKLEYFCRMEVFYNGRRLKSPLSTSVTAIAEEAPVRLVSAFPGPACAGRLQMFVRGFWAPVCHGRNQDLAVGLVACRQLQCGDALLASYVSASPIKQGEFFMGPVDCKGTEANLRECSVEAFQRYCYKGQQMEIVCSNFLPPPRLSVHGYGSVSSVYVHEESPLEITCTLMPEWLINAEIELVEASSGNTRRSPHLKSGESAKWELDAPVRPGEYSCYITLYSFNHLVKSGMSNSVTVTTGSWFPPSAGLIVGALFSILIGAGILIYMCFWRVHKEESQETSPEEEQTEAPWAGAENQAITSGDNTENPQTNTEDS